MTCGIATAGLAARLPSHYSLRYFPPVKKMRLPCGYVTDRCAMNVHKTSYVIAADEAVNAIRLWCRGFKGMNRSTISDERCEQQGEKTDVRSDVIGALSRCDVLSDHTLDRPFVSSEQHVQIATGDGLRQFPAGEVAEQDARWIITYQHEGSDGTSD